jgi:hypothetical protein
MNADADVLKSIIPFSSSIHTARSDNTGAEISGVTVFEIVPPTPDKFYKEGDIVSSSN